MAELKEEHRTTKMAFTLTSRVGLQNGKDIPVLGFGTYESSTEEAYTSVKQALEAGYRHIVSR